MTPRATHFSPISGIALAVLVGLVALAIVPTPARAQYENDTLAVATGGTTRAGAELSVTAGPSGAPGGFSIWWMKRSDFEANGRQWFPGGAAFQMEASFTGIPTLHTQGGTLTSFTLAPNQAAEVEIGDIFDETGVTANSVLELEPGTEYVFCGFVNAGGGLAQSDYSTTYASVTLVSSSCIFSQGYWKTHPSAWPVSSLTLGTVTYTKTELLAILNTPAAGNGLISLAHQFIATLLNIANGGNPASISSSITAANALIGSLVIPPVGSGYLAPATTSSLTQAFDDYNTGSLEGCITPANSPTWGAIKTLYR